MSYIGVLGVDDAAIVEILLIVEFKGVAKVGGFLQIGAKCYVGANAQSAVVPLSAEQNGAKFGALHVHRHRFLRVFHRLDGAGYYFPVHIFEIDTLRRSHISSEPSGGNRNQCNSQRMPRHNAIAHHRVVSTDKTESYC